MRPLLIIGILTAALLSGCAKQGYPTGGPKDTQPPKAVSVNPPSGTLNFSQQGFYIQFDEYVTVKDADNNILISPPMEKKPEYVQKGHGIMVKIKDTLKENTTYLFQFKGAIVDFNEGNPLESLEYAFSTGNCLDTMTLEGWVEDALTGKPSENTVSVHLYEAPTSDGALWDSAVCNQIPVYVTRTDRQGRFQFHNIRPGAYRLAALEDEDRNMRYAPSEAIAFCDTLVHSCVPVKADTAAADSLTADTAKAGSKRPAATDSTRTPEKKHLLLRLSKTLTQPQRILKSEYLRKGRIQISFQSPLQAPVLSDADSLQWVLNAGKDTLDIWCRNENSDSLRLVISDPSGIQDTLSLKYRKKKSTPMQAGNTPLMRSMVKSAHPYFDTLWVRFENPIARILGADTVVEVMNLADSTRMKCPLRLDSTGLKAMIQLQPAQGIQYKFFIPKDRVYDLYGHSADSLAFTTTITKADEYGNILIHLIHHQQPASAVVQLLGANGVLVSQKCFEGSGDVEFQKLLPGKYMLRVVLDANGNGKWDPGDYWKGTQPEEVRTYSKTLELRANWDMEEAWTIDDVESL